jgi:hypothetical protein
MRVGYSFDRDRLLGRFDETVKLTGLDELETTARNIVIDFAFQRRIAVYQSEAQR